MMRVNTRNAAKGFTLVEMLTVIAIIGILIAILVPAVSAVRDNARSTASRATLAAIDTGLESFRANTSVGDGYYPPSASDRLGRQKEFTVNSPYDDAQKEMAITGAGLLVWAMVGADFLGPTGFKVFRTNNARQRWSDDTDAVFGTGPSDSGAYSLTKTGGKTPVQPRVAPFIDLDKVKITPRSSTVAGKFEVERETETLSGQNKAPIARDYPMFVDAFGTPILYWRADPAGTVIADLPGNTSGDPVGIYHFKDNGFLLQTLGGSGRQEVLQTVQPRGTRWLHNLTWVDPPNRVGGGQVNLDGFPKFIQNMQITAKPTPHRANSYILLSAGKDGIYGSADDIANFDHNGGLFNQ